MGSGGIQLNAESHVEHVLAVSNGTTGIQVGCTSLVRDWRATRKGGVGITPASSIVDGNVTSGDGIESGSVVFGSCTSLDQGYGLDQGGTSGYSGNVLTFDTLGPVSGGVQIGSNRCRSNTTCP